MTVAACPKPETLAAFARGDMTADELAAVAEHVGQCDACCRALKLVPEDSLAGLARAAAANPVALAATNLPGAQTDGSTNKGKPPTKKIPAGFADHPRYRIISELGAGGMGTVYKAEDLLMGRIVAIKVVSPHLTAKANAVERFRREVRVAAQLNDPRAIIAHDTGEAGGCQFLVMEYVEGVSLDRLVTKKGPLPLTMACLLTRQASLGLQHAADKGMVHRDIKPQNLMVTRKGQVKILDFGLARFAHSNDEEESLPSGRLPFGAGRQQVDNGVTNPNMLMGTPDYLSPEQAKNSHDVDSRSDIYSLGCTLYFLLTGKPPFSDSTTLIDKLRAHTNEEPMAIRDARPEVPEGLAEILAKMMAKNPADRYQKASEVATAIHPFTRSNAAEPVFEIVEAEMVSTPRVVLPVALSQAAVFDTAPSPNVPTLAEFAKPKKKKPKKRASWFYQRKWALAGCAALVLLLVAFAIAVSRKGDEPNDNTNTNEPPTNAKADSPRTNPQGKGSEAANKGSKGSTPGLNTVVAPPKKVLYVLPSDGIWRGDYEPVRKKLEKNDVTVKTTSTKGGEAKYKNNSSSVKMDFPLSTAINNLSDYSAVIFAGADVDEYLPNGSGSIAAKTMMRKMAESKRVVAGICIGQAVLAYHGFLEGKNAAWSHHLFDRYPPLKGSKWAKWTHEGKQAVISDSKFITASSDSEAGSFADAILDAIHAR